MYIPLTHPRNVLPLPELKGDIHKNAFTPDLYIYKIIHTDILEVYTSFTFIESLEYFGVILIEGNNDDCDSIPLHCVKIPHSSLSILITLL